MLLTVLGSCANQIANREGVSMLIEDSKSSLLIDCGPGIVAALGRCNRRASDVNHLFLTHVHGDHIAGFPYFVWNRNFERMGKEPAKDLYVYGQKDAIELAKFSLEHCYPELSFPFNVFYKEIVPNQTIKCDELEVFTIEAAHTVPCLGCIVKSNRKKIVYTSDSLYNEKLIPLSMYADILVHEGMMPDAMSNLASRVKHSLASEAGKFASQINAKLLLLVHVAPSMLGEENKLLGEAKNHYKGIAAVPHDGCVYII